MSSHEYHKFYHQTVKMLKAHGDLYTFEDILTEIAKGTMQSFARNDSWVVTQVNVFPRKRVLDIVFVVGDIKDVLELEDEIVEFAEYLECDLIMANGRKGWLRRRKDNDVLPRSSKWRLFGATFIRETSSGTETAV